GDGQRRAHRLAQLAGDAALLAVRIAALRVQTAKAHGLGSLLVRVVQRDLAAKQRAQRHEQALPQLDEQECLDRIGYFHGPTCPQAMTPSTAIHTSVTGISTFQPSRMIWS